MDLNYQHLRYFWVAARAGSVTGAARRMRLSPSTVSSQIKQLEAWLGEPLFERRGRNLHLTVRGQVVKQYADDIFALGEEMVDATRSATGLRHAYRLRVGVGNHLPKLVARELLSPALAMPDFPVHLVVLEDRADRLVADLAVHHLDLVLADRPVALALDVHAESRLLGESSLSLMATPALADSLKGPFPASLDGAPVLLPEVGSAMRDLLEDWFRRQGLRPRIVAEFGDSALVDSFGQSGAGIFAVPTVVRDVVAKSHRVVCLGELEDTWEQLYAVVMPSKKTNPAVEAVLHAADSIRYHRREESD